MIKLGIIGAMQVEVETLVEKLEHAKTWEKPCGLFVEGKLNHLDVVIVRCGVGKVNAAMCVQVLCDCFAVTHLVNTGIAGSLCAELDIGDLVVSKDAMYHDMDVRVFGYAMGQVPGTEQPEFVADEAMISLAWNAAEAVHPGHTRMGRVASGDQFVCSPEQKKKIIADTGATCAEMEGAAIAHTAAKNGIPFVILRAISDKADGSAEMDYPTFETIAAHRCAEVTSHMASAMVKWEP